MFLGISTIKIPHEFQTSSTNSPIISNKISKILHINCNTGNLSSQFPTGCQKKIMEHVLYRTFKFTRDNKRFLVSGEKKLAYFKFWIGHRICTLTQITPDQVKRASGSFNNIQSLIYQKLIKQMTTKRYLSFWIAPYEYHKERISQLLENKTNQSPVNLLVTYEMGWKHRSLGWWKENKKWWGACN